MSSESEQLTVAQVEDDYAYNEWDTDAEEEEVPRRKAFRRWHAAELAAAERRGAVRALREAAEWASKNVFISMDSREIYEHLLVRADQMEADQ